MNVFNHWNIFDDLDLCAVCLSVIVITCWGKNPLPSSDFWSADADWSGDDHL